MGNCLKMCFSTSSSELEEKFIEQSRSENSSLTSVPRGKGTAPSMLDAVCGDY